MKNIKLFIDYVVKIYVRLHIKKTFYSVAFIYFAFIIRECATHVDFVTNFFNILSIESESAFGKLTWKFLALFFQFDISNWAVLGVSFVFLLLWILRFMEVNRIVLSKRISKDIEKIKHTVEETHSFFSAGIKNWDEWKKTPYFDSKYVQNNAIVELLNQIKKESVIEKNIIRIFGLSGLGKTRLVFEAFNSNNQNILSGDLTSKILYSDVSRYSHSLKSYLPSIYNKEFKIIIADNCSNEVYKELAEIVLRTDSKLSLITIDFDTKISGIEKPILLKNEMFKDVTEQILTNHYAGQLQKSEITRIAEFADGFPQMAVLFAKASIQGNIDLATLLEDDVLIKLVWGRGQHNDVAFKVIKACSIFTSLGMKEISETEGKFVAEKICEISWKTFYAECVSFIDRGIMEPRGNRIVVKPPPLAVSLASGWWKEFPPNDIRLLLDDVTKQNLSQQLCDRLSMLGHLEVAKEIVAKLCGDNGFFRNAEVLNSELGSRLFRSLVEANPEVTVNALVNVFSSKSKEELLKINKGRRNLVWALEKLCFKKETFSRAVKILYSFAVAENETWGNNSTNQFRQLFQLGLPGTEASLSERIEILKYGLLQPEKEYIKLAILAMGAGLRNDGFHRMMGAEKQGIGKPLEDNKPEWKEIIEYWEFIIDSLTELIMSNEDYKTEAKTALIGGMQTLLRDGLSEKISGSLKRIIEKNGNHWPEALSHLKRILAKEASISEATVEITNELVELLSPNDLESKFKLIISHPVFEKYEKDKDGHYIDFQRIRAEEFAQELLKTDDNWQIFLPILFKGEQRQAGNFGKSLGELLPNPMDFISTSLQILKSIPKEERNPELLGGFLSAISDKVLIKKILDLIINDDALSEHSFYFTKAINPRFEDIIQLFVLIENKKMPISSFLIFKYGRALDNLTQEEIIILGNKLSEYGGEGKWVALTLIDQYCYGSIEKWNNCRSFIKDLIKSENFLKIKGNHIDTYNWQDAIEKILSVDSDKDFIQTIAKHIVEFCSDKLFNYNQDVYVKNILTKLFDNHFDIVWTEIANGIIGDSMTYFHLKSLLGGQNGNWGNGGILFRVQEKYSVLIEWCRNNSPLAPERLISMTPLECEINGKVEWHPLTIQLIDEFGGVGKTLDYLSNNLGSYGITGSIIPYLTTIKMLLSKLTNHKNRKVSEWAVKQVEYYEKYIKAENISEEERFL